MNNLFLDFIYDKEFVKVYENSAYGLVLKDKVENLNKVTVKEFLHHAQEIADSLPMVESIEFLQVSFTIAVYTLNKKVFNC